MGWYDFFSRFYDSSLEALYAPTRTEAAQALDLQPGHVVLDVPCGTGQSFDAIVPAIGDAGRLVGIDLSQGMLARARRRADAAGWSNVHLVRASVYDVTTASLADVTGGQLVDRLHIFLGLTAMDRYEEAFAKLWDLLAPGGRCIIVDVHAARPSFQGRMVNLVARADIRREVWIPLSEVAEDYERRDLPSLEQHGGTLFLATGRKPG